MTHITKQLKEIGLTPNQAFLYTTLTKLGTAKAGEIIKKTGFHRNLVYVALQELLDKKLISSSKVRGVHTYKTLSPSHLLVSIQDKERIAKQVIEELDALNTKPNTQEIITHEGIDEFRRHAVRSYSIMKKGDIARYLGTSQRWHTIIGPTLEKELQDLQNDKGVIMRGLTKSLSHKMLDYAKKTGSLTEIRSNPLISSDTNNIEILNDRISIQSFVKPYFVIEITNKDLASNYRNYFDFLWEHSK